MTFEYLGKINEIQELINGHKTRCLNLSENSAKFTWEQISNLFQSPAEKCCCGKCSEQAHDDVKEEVLKGEVNATSVTESETESQQAPNIEHKNEKPTRDIREEKGFYTGAEILSILNDGRKQKIPSTTFLTKLSQYRNSRSPSPGRKEGQKFVYTKEEMEQIVEYFEEITK